MLDGSGLIRYTWDYLLLWGKYIGMPIRNTCNKTRFWKKGFNNFYLIKIIKPLEPSHKHSK